MLRGGEMNEPMSNSCSLREKIARIPEFQTAIPEYTLLHMGPVGLFLFSNLFLPQAIP